MKYQEEKKTRHSNNYIKHVFVRKLKWRKTFGNKMKTILLIYKTTTSIKSDSSLAKCCSIFNQSIPEMPTLSVVSKYSLPTVVI